MPHQKMFFLSSMKYGTKRSIAKNARRYVTEIKSICCKYSITSTVIFVKIKTAFSKEGFSVEDNVDASLTLIIANMLSYDEEMSSGMDLLLKDIIFIKKLEQDQHHF